MAAYFGSHPLGNSILGTVESVEQLTSEAMRAYFQQRYSPSNIALVAAGRIDFDRLIRSAEQRCGGWPAFAAPRETPIATGRADFRTLVKENVTQQYIVQITAGPSATDEDRFACRVLSSIVGDDSGSRFFWELVDPGRAEYAGMGPYEFQGAGIVMTFLSCAPERAAENLERVLRLLRSVEKDGVTEAELELARNKICSQLVRSSERPSNRLFSVGNGWLQRRSYQTIQERMTAYQRVDRDAVHAVLAKYPLTTNTTVTIGPLLEVPQPA